MNLITELARLPDLWGFVAVDGKKRPYQSKWQNNPLNKADLTLELNAGRAKAIGVCCGELSGGLLFLDHDGKSVSELLKQWGYPMSSLPRSWTVTSGRNGRFQVIYKVPQHYWENIQTRKYKTGTMDADNKPEQIELRWNGCQSVVAGAHPVTAGYKWVKGYAPEDIELAEAPICLIEKMLKPQLSDDAARARSYLAALSSSRTDDYDDWLLVGMALHSIGDDSLLADWDQWSAQSSKYKPGCCKTKWDSFKKSGITLGSLGDLAKKDGWRASRKQLEPPSKPPALAPPVEAKPILDKPSKLETLELLTYLRTTTDNIRFNTFTRQIEINEKPLIGIERYYLTLAEQNVKVSKELAIDCLVQVANERQYDPVTEYLDNCAKVVKPTYIDRLATAYLRPQDAVTPEPTIYDEMLKRTLIGAVARAFDPGCKHDTACVLMGGQGSFKSTFWHKLGGLFFSDALGDIGSKDDVMVLHRSWIMEWAELDQITSRKHAGHIKSFLSRPVDMLRVPYGKAVEDFPRRGIIVGTTNKSAGFLVDETGNRRFWVIPTTKTDQDQIDTDSLEKERDSIWSAAVLAYRNGETSRLPAHLEQLVTNENDAYVVDSPWRDVVATYLTTRSSVEPLTSEELLTKAINKPVERQTRIDQMQIATILKDLGYIKQREPHGRRRWHYSRG